MSSFYYGPINKNIYTQQYELLTKCILKEPSSVKISYSNNNVIATVNNTVLNLSNILQKMDFNHLSLNHTDSKLYTSFVSKNNYHPDKNICTNNNHKFSDLTYGEKVAINLYSRGSFSNINKYLFNSINVPNLNNQKFAEELIVNTAMLASALNKIPSTLINQKSFRGEYISQIELKQRIEKIPTEDFVKNSAFLSTSSSISTAQGFTKNSFITFDNLYGKDIKFLSSFPHENEYLLLPGKLQFTKYSKNYNYNFEATVINPLEEDSDALPDENALENFNNLIEWAKTNNISNDFLIDFWANILKSNENKIQKISPNNVTNKIELTDVINQECNSIEKLVNNLSTQEANDTTKNINSNIDNNIKPQTIIIELTLPELTDQTMAICA